MTEKILVVDDEEANLRLLTQWLSVLGYEIELALNGEEAVQTTRVKRPDLVILDIMMPVMDGYAACNLIKTDPETTNIPIIMVTALNDRESKLRGLSAGANDFLSKPIDQTELTIRVKNLLKIKAFEDFMFRHNQILEEEVRKRTLELDDAFKELESMSTEMVQKLTAAAEFRDTDTGAHISRIGFYAREIAGTLDLPPDIIETITYASQLHDIGK